MKRYLIGMILMISSLNSFAQDEHLIPMESKLLLMPTEHEILLRDYLFIDVTYSTLAKIVIVPSFENVHSMAIRTDDSSKYFLNTITILNHFKRGLPIQATNEIQVGEVFAKSMNKLFLKIVSQTRFPQVRSEGTDGTTYYFVVSDYENVGTFYLVGKGYGVISGQIWSPDSNRFKKLVAFCESLYQVKTKKEYDEKEKSFIEICDSLMKDF